MPETTGTTPAAQAGPPPVPTMAELMTEVQAEATARGAAKPSAAPASDAAPAVDGSTPAATPEKPAEVAKEGDDVSLARLAKEQRRIDKQKAALESDRKALSGAAEDGQKWREARALAATSKLDAVKAVFGEEALEEVYWALNDHVLKNHKEPTTDDVVDRKVEEKLTARMKAAEDAAKAKADDAEKKAREEQEATAARAAEGLAVTIRDVNALLQKDVAKYPALMAAVNAYGKRGKQAVSRGDIEAFMKGHHGAKGALPTEAEILDHFEAELRATFDEIRPASDSVPGTRTVTSSWRADSPVKEAKDLTLAEITEQAKREAGILK